MRAHRHAAGMGAAVAALLLLAGCATSGGGTTTPEEEGGSTDSGPITLRFQSLAFQEPTVEASKAIVDEWNAANPDVQVEYVQGSWDSVHDQLVTQFQGGSAPDIIHDESADIAGFAAQGYLADLGPYLSDEVMSGVSEGVWETVTVDGKIVAAPTLLQSYMVFANTDLLEAAGVEIPTGDTWTWDDFSAAAQATTTGGVSGVGWGLKSPTATVMSLGLNFDGTFFSGEGADVAIEVGDNELEVPLRIHDMAYVDGSIDPTSLTQSGGDVLPGFLSGDYAMTVQGSYAAQTVTEQAPDGFNWAVMPPLEGTSAAQNANPQTLSVPAESEHVEDAAAFINFFMEADNLAAVAQGDWLIPTSTEARDAVLSATGGEGGWDQTLASGDILTVAPFQKVEAYPQWKDQIATPALQQYFADQIDLEGLRTQLTDGWASVGGA
ncbi:MAG: sugar ABC transporter substrate-binding protein [Sporichthyaceae bacterium]|nr:sugar ABC transporter substrate-binding protein [Sporichthyaceae bacterium]